MNRQFIRSITTFLFLSFITWKAFAAFEVSGEFAYEKQKYGTDNENKITERTYSGILAWYIFSTTAIEFQYSFEKKYQIDNSDVKYTGTSYSIDSVQNVIDTETYGVGLRQLLLPPKSRVLPMVTLGYARQIVNSVAEINFRNDDTNVSTLIEQKYPTQKEDSISAAVALQVALAQRFSLRGSVKTVFPANDFNAAGDYMKYSAGFSWIF